MKTAPPKPELREVPLSDVVFAGGTVTFTMSPGQWNALLAAAYTQGHTLLELDENERPVRAYRKCQCDLCAAAGGNR